MALVNDMHKQRMEAIAEKRQAALEQHFMKKDAQGQQRADASAWTTVGKGVSTDGSGRLVAFQINNNTGETRENVIEAKPEPKGAGGGVFGAGIDAETSAAVEKWVAGGGQIPRNPVQAKIIAGVVKADPEVNPALLKNLPEMQKRFTIAGKEGGQLKSINQLAEHIDAANEIMTDLRNGKYKDMNAAKNALAQRFGGEFAADAAGAATIGEVISNETTRMLAQTSSGQTALADRGIQRQLQNLEQASPETWEGTSTAIYELMHGQIVGLEPFYKAANLEKSMGDLKHSKLLIKRVQGIMDEIDNRNASKSGGGNAPAPGDVVKGYKFKGGNPADKNNWEKT
jgi:hypothetical protein